MSPAVSPGLRSPALHVPLTHGYCTRTFFIPLLQSNKHPSLHRAIPRLPKIPVPSWPRVAFLPVQPGGAQYCRDLLHRQGNRKNSGVLPRGARGFAWDGLPPHCPVCPSAAQRSPRPRHAPAWRAKGNCSCSFRHLVSAYKLNK